MRKIYLTIFLLLLLLPCFKSNAQQYVYSNTKNTVIIEDVVYSKLTSLGTYTLTGYCSCGRCCGINTGITASGTNVVQGRTIAADTSILPFGTKVYIDGNIYTVEDRGGAIKNNRIDIYFNSHEQALQFGLKQQEIFIVEEEIIQMIQVEYLEYKSITGEWFKNKTANCKYDSTTNETMWIDNNEKIIAHRKKIDNNFVNYIDLELYKQWKGNN